MITRRTRPIFNYKMFMLITNKLRQDIIISVFRKELLRLSILQNNGEGT